MDDIIPRKRKPMSEETKQKISKANSGENNGMYKRVHSEETRKKISEAAKKMWENSETRSQILNNPIRKINCQKGGIASAELWKKTHFKHGPKFQSLEAREKISEAAKKMWENPIIRSQILNNPIRKINCRKGAVAAQKVLFAKGYFDTKPELLMKDILTLLGVKFERGYSIWDIEHCYSCDFYVSEYKLVIEVDGLYWHNYPNYNERDLIRNKELADKGYKVLRFWEDGFDLLQVYQKLKEIGLIFQYNDDYYKKLKQIEEGD